MDNIVIRGIKVFAAAPRGINLIIVKAETLEPELPGYGCTAFTWRYKAAVIAIEGCLCSMLKGKSVYDIEGIWQTIIGGSYWRNGPILNNAISGVDEALWDIKGKPAGMPFYSLFDGKARKGVTIYRHADRGCLEEVKECISQYTEEGYRHIRCHMGIYGGNFDGGCQQMVKLEGVPEGAYLHPKVYIDSVIRLFEQVRKDFGRELEVMHDVHEWLSLADILTLIKKLEPFKPFFLEDSLAPGQAGYYKHLRGQAAVSLTMGELSTNPIEWEAITQNQWTDFIRIHSSDIGDVIPAVKLAHLCDAYGVRTVRHGPNDLSPIGMRVQMYLDLDNHNFGIQGFPDSTQEEEAIFPGCPKVRDEYAYADDTPGIGVDFDEKETTKYPAVDMDHGWLFARLLNGTAVRPQGGHCAAGFYMVNRTNNRTRSWP